MSKHIKGKYRTKACVKRFNALKELQNNMASLIAFEQNDMLVNEQDIETAERIKDGIVLALNTWFEDKLADTKLENSDD